MDQVTGAVSRRYDGGEQFLITSYIAECGCRWVVDMWGNVRTVEICHHCNSRWVVDAQFDLKLVD